MARSANGRFRLPFTQQDLADACGLSKVHINRTIQELRKSGLLEWREHTVSVLRREELETVSEFSTEYLHGLEVPSGQGATTNDLKLNGRPKLADMANNGIITRVPRRSPA
ncbi:winged helix-turn-helix domain-containing protein [Bradyrhizobium genosp. L]|uniref:Crp/Fnr family transcriptional regulator n=1 Tax=Bradyrhizobium genosp. L TaxID=83637 RepID=UPI0018A2C125|nr:helix-turn-helix domain-containing protein [Bradyrhizobium genosp. L]QPF88344.1 winged helix-turn-helix domain-containing protein [Bradyrhizobium genosp. L]